MSAEWNSLPDPITSMASLPSFRRQLSAALNIEHWTLRRAHFILAISTRSLALSILSSRSKSRTFTIERLQHLSANDDQMSLSQCSSWHKLSLHYTKINNIMHAEKTLNSCIISGIGLNTDFSKQQLQPTTPTKLVHQLWGPMFQATGSVLWNILPADLRQKDIGYEQLQKT